MPTPPELGELSSEERISWARVCLDRLAGPGAPTFVETLDADGNLVRSAQWSPSGRPFRLVARLDPDDAHAGNLGNVDLRVDVDNRLGYIDLVYDPDEPTASYLAEVAPTLYVSDTDQASRAWMHETVARLGVALIEPALAFLRSFDHYKVELRANDLRVMLADLTWDDEDWLDIAPDPMAQVEALDAIAAIIEMQLPETFATCQYCRRRFDLSMTPRCPHCGAAPA